MKDPNDEYSEFNEGFDDRMGIEKITRDETEIYNRLIDVKRNVDLFKTINDRIEKGKQLLETYAGLLKERDHHQEVTQKSFIELFDRNLDEEEVRRYSRLRSLIGINSLPDPRDEAAEKAALELQHARLTTQQREERILQQIDDVREQLNRDEARLNMLIEHVVNNSDDRIFDEIRDQLRNGSD